MTLPRAMYVVSSPVSIFHDKPEPAYGALKASINRLGLLDLTLMWRETVADGIPGSRPDWNWALNRGSRSSLPTRTPWKSWQTDGHSTASERDCPGCRGGAGHRQAEAGPPEGVKKKPRKFARFPDAPVAWT